MKTLIISPHTDDAIFSLGDLMQTMPEVTILSVFAGIPKDPVGLKKHWKLRAEHEIACRLLGVDHIEGRFFDDVYQPRPERARLKEWFKRYLSEYEIDEVISPLGIHHPDHILVREILTEDFGVHRFYVELPYAVRYPQLHEELVAKFAITHIKRTAFPATSEKREAALAYQSQVDENVLKDVLVPEIIYD